MSVTPKFDVIVCGSLHLDIVVKAPAIPRIDETMVGSAWSKVCGGKGGNQAVQAARAGARTAMIGCVGDDDFGQTLRANLAAAGVDHACVTCDTQLGSGMSVAILQNDGDYGAVIVSGSNLAIDPALLETQLTTLSGAKILVLQNEIPETVNIAAARAANAAGLQVVLNAAPARALNDDLLHQVDVLIVNRVEAEAMYGAPVADRTTARAVLKKHRPSHQSVIITLGGEGLVMAEPGKEAVEIEPHPVTVVSTHGAGDCFVGVLAAELARGKSLLEACTNANRKAAAFVAGNR